MFVSIFLRGGPPLQQMKRPTHQKLDQRAVMILRERSRVVSLQERVHVLCRLNERTNASTRWCSRVVAHRRGWGSAQSGGWWWFEGWAAIAAGERTTSPSSSPSAPQLPRQLQPLVADRRRRPRTESRRDVGVVQRPEPIECLFRAQS